MSSVTHIAPEANVQADATPSRVKNRRPMLSGQFYPSPLELHIYGPALNLDGIDKLVIEAIDRTTSGSAEWDVTYGQIAEAAGLPLRTVEKRISNPVPDPKSGRPGLVQRGLVVRERVRFKGRNSGVRLDLTPLWEKLAEAAQAEANRRSGGTDDASNRRCGGSTNRRSGGTSFRGSVPKKTSHGSSSRSEEIKGGGNSAREAESTATTTTSVTNSSRTDQEGDDDWVDTENLLDAYAGAVEYETGRRPKERRGDRQAALDLLPELRDESDEPWIPFIQVIEWGLQDDYSRPRLLNSFAAAAKCYPAIAVQYDAAPVVTCTGCDDTFTAGDGMQKRIQKHGDLAELLCPTCFKERQNF